MKNAKLFLLITALALALLMGCGPAEDTVPSVSPYIGGSQGIVVNFEDFGVVEEGIATIYEGETFPVEITLKNKGEEDVEAGALQITLKGISLADFEGLTSPKTNEDLLEKVSEFNLQGGEDTVDMGDARYLPEILTSFYLVDVFAEVVYPYKTHVAVPKVCFKEDLLDPSVCTVDEAKEVFSSGSPIKVTKVEEKRAGTGLIALEYQVENVGGGQVTKPGEVFDRRYGQIEYSVDPGSRPEDWECKSGGMENEARLADGRAVIRCKLKDALAEDTLYTKEIDITLSYDYKQLIQQSVKIKGGE
jgi:hypothetical protein